MFHLVYTSQALEPFSNAELVNLLLQSREFNKSERITGMLIYRNRKFIQALEGRKIAVKRLYGKIQKDSRHERVTLLMEGDSPHRIFKNWSMGFRILTDADIPLLEGFQDVDDFFERQQAFESSNLVMVFLQLFYKKNLVDYPEQVE